MMRENNVDYLPMLSKPTYLRYIDPSHPAGPRSKSPSSNLSRGQKSQSGTLKPNRPSFHPSFHPFCLFASKSRDLIIPRFFPPTTNSLPEMVKVSLPSQVFFSISSPVEGRRFGHHRRIPCAPARRKKRARSRVRYVRRKGPGRGQSRYPALSFPG